MADQFDKIEKLSRILSRSKSDMLAIARITLEHSLPIDISNVLDKMTDDTFDTVRSMVKQEPPVGIAPVAAKSWATLQDEDDAEHDRVWELQHGLNGHV